MPSPLCWLMTTPGTVSSTSPVRINGRASSCRAVMAPWLADCAMPTRFSAGRSTSARLVKVDLPVTVTSALSESCSVTSSRSGPAAVTAISTSHGAEVDQGEGHHRPARRHAVEAVGAARVRLRPPRRRGSGGQLDEDPGQRVAGLVADGPDDLDALRRGRRDGTEGGEGERREQAAEARHRGQLGVLGPVTDWSLYGRLSATDSSGVQWDACR